MSQAMTARKRATKPAAERRREILAAGLALFDERGFDETSVADIARRAGVAAGTVYLYFPSKEHILLALHKEVHEGMGARMAGAVTDLQRRRAAGEEISFEYAIDRVLDAIFAYILENRRCCVVMARYVPRAETIGVALRDEQPCIDAMALAFEDTTRAGRMHVSDPEMAAYLLFNALETTVGHSLAYGNPPDFDRLMAQAKELFQKALAPR